jgi:hypothetical protein
MLLESLKTIGKSTKMLAIIAIKAIFKSVFKKTNDTINVAIPTATFNP